MRAVLVVLAAVMAASLTPVALAEPPAGVPRRVERATPRLLVSAGGEHTCSVRSDRSLWCFGRNAWGQSWLGSQGAGKPFARQYGESENWWAVSSGGASTCGIRLGGSLWCWGLNHRGQLGDGTTNTRLAPVHVARGRAFSQVRVGYYSTCAIAQSGWLWCWGDNVAGQLGLGDHTDRRRPAVLSGGWRDVAVGGWHTCGVKDDGSLWCWGRNLFGQLGIGSFGDRARPTRVGTANSWTGVEASWTHTCARRTSGSVWCWGRNNTGQLGDGSRIDRDEPQVAVRGTPFELFALTEGTTCGVGAAGGLRCWGSIPFGRLRRSDAGIARISGGWLHLCLVTRRGRRECVGHNDWGQLGTGTRSNPVATSGRARVQEPAAGSRRGFSFRLATMNVLGEHHTRPYRKDDRFASDTVRSRWTGDALQVLGPADVIGLQETDPRHLANILRAAKGRYAAFPAPKAGDGAVEAPLLWRRSVWRPTALRTIKTQFISRELPRPVVRLQHRATGRQIWVMNTHNAPWDYQAKRNKATRVQLAVIRQLRKSGLPVFFIGDMNEKRSLLCKVLWTTDLYSPIGGRIEDGRCRNPEQRMRVDWIFGSRDVSFSGFEHDRSRLVKVSTDHHVPVVTARVR